MPIARERSLLALALYRSAEASQARRCLGEGLEHAEFLPRHDLAGTATYLHYLPMFVGVMEKGANAGYICYIVICHAWSVWGIAGHPHMMHSLSLGDVTM